MEFKTRLAEAYSRLISNYKTPDVEKCGYVSFLTKASTSFAFCKQVSDALN
jgi:hypothetical protein